VRTGTYERQVNNRRLSGINPGAAPAHPFPVGRQPGDPSPVDAATPPAKGQRRQPYVTVDPPATDGIGYANPLSRSDGAPARAAGFAAVERGYPPPVRDAYQEQLDQLANGLADMCNLVADALDNATRALLRADLRLAEQVITADARIDQLRTAAEEQAFTLLIQQAPVATDLRIVVSALHAASDIERMGDLALHIAEAARRRHPDLVMPAEIAPYFAEMGRVGSALARKAGAVIRTLDLVRAGQIEADDDAMDDLHRHLFTMLANPTWPHGVGPAVDITLIGRFYERYADHAVALARRVVYVVTGRMPDPVAA
jgi:phosphate transport system protein